jgi:glycosyltransferase involved in cell wall biosynthesis
MKTTEVVPGHWGDPHGQWQRLLDAASADPRIEIIVEAQEFTEFLGLIADCDCIVSSHRAEGFGYLPAFAMLLGRPAIVTDYSGTQEYCDETTAFPVRWTPRPMAPEEAIFAVPGAHWAEIDVAHLAERMAEVFADPAAAATRAAAGRALLEREFSHAALAGRYGARLRELGALPAEIRGIP